MMHFLKNPKIGMQTGQPQIPISMQTGGPHYTNPSPKIGMQTGQPQIPVGQSNLPTNYIPSGNYDPRSEDPGAFRARINNIFANNPGPTLSSGRVIESDLPELPSWLNSMMPPTSPNLPETFGITRPSPILADLESFLKFGGKEENYNPNEQENFGFESPRSSVESSPVSMQMTMPEPPQLSPSKQLLSQNIGSNQQNQESQSPYWQAPQALQQERKPQWMNLPSWFK